MRALAGHVSRAMLSWYSHIRTDAKRAVTSALDQIGDAWEVADSGRGTAQNLGTISCSTQAHTQLTP
jgi:hypothetical protein